MVRGRGHVHGLARLPTVQCRDGPLLWPIESETSRKAERIRLKDLSLRVDTSSDVIPFVSILGRIFNRMVPGGRKRTRESQGIRMCARQGLLRVCQLLGSRHSRDCVLTVVGRPSQSASSLLIVDQLTCFELLFFPQVEAAVAGEDHWYDWCLKNKSQGRGK